MRIVIAGTRGVKDIDVVDKAVKASPFTVTEIMAAGLQGSDSAAEKWAARRNIPIRFYAPRTGKWQEGAALRCFADMIEKADGVIYIDRHKKAKDPVLKLATKAKSTIFVYDAPTKINPKPSD